MSKKIGVMMRAAIALAVLCPVALAQAGGNTAAILVVNVSGMSKPDERAYAKIVEAMNLFEKLHAMAPQATLRFELLPAHARVSMKDTELHIVGSERRVAVPLASDRTFTVPRLPYMLDERALLTSNRRDDSFLWRSRIRTPGLPANTRRLGDLRLEWHVDYVGALGPQWLSPGTRIAMAMMDRPYEMRGLHHMFLADRPLFGVTLVAGARRQVLATDMLYLSGLTKALPSPLLGLWKNRRFLMDRAFDLPLSDSSWPDDTLIVFDYMDDAQETMQ